MANQLSGWVSSRLFGVGIQVLAACGLLSLPATADAAAGSIGGNLRISNEGAATYTIPLFAPPGPKGMQPGVALTYSSNGGPGIVGRGWNLAGFSKISRCPRTAAQDAASAPVKLQADDAYCLDGNRLRLVEGTYSQGASVYATEMEDFSRITVHASAVSGPLTFEVKRRDGLIYTYGGTIDSRVLATGTQVPHVWMVSQIRDLSGNRVVFTYQAPNSLTSGTTHPVRIEWTATSFNASTWLYRMDFSYSENTWAGSQFGNVANTEVREKALLTGVTVSESGNLKRNYVLDYSLSLYTGSKRLTSIKECIDVAGTNCLLPTTITYPFEATAVPVLSQTGSIEAVWGQFDIDGDSASDLLYQRSGTTYARFGSAGGYGAEVAATLPQLPALRSVDMAGDGRDQILVPNATTSTWHSLGWNGATLASTDLGLPVSPAPSGLTGSADVNGDGHADLVGLTYGSSSPTVSVSLYYNLAGSTGTPSYLPYTPYAGAVPLTLSPTPPSGRVISGGPTYLDVQSGSRIRGLRGKFDADRDGREDLVLWGSFQACVPSTSACNAVTRAWMLLSGSNYSIPRPIPVPSDGYQSTLPADFNGDGCIDTFTPTAFATSDCNGGMAVTGGIPFSAEQPVKGALDWNGDGRDDLVTYIPSLGTLKVRLFQGNGFGDLIATSIPANATCPMVKTDMNGDSLQEVGCHVPLAQVYVYSHHADAWIDRVATISNGKGVKHTLSYKDISDPSVYTFDATVTAPRQAVQGGVRVVSRVATVTGPSPDQSFHIDYTYGNATANPGGRGYEGFGWVQSVDSRNGVRTRRDFSKEFPYTGALVGEASYQSDNTPISVRSVTLGHKTLDSTAFNQRYSIYPLSSEGTTYEVASPSSFGAGKNGIPITHTLTDVTADDWGLPVTVATTITDLDADSPFSGQSWSSQQDYAYALDATSGGYWCPGMPSTVTTTDSVPGEAAFVRGQGFTNDYLRCRVLVEAVGSGARQVDTTYGYDIFGNVNSVSVQGRNPDGSNMTARTSQITWGSANGTTAGTGQFPVAEKNALNQTTNRTFHSTFGTLLTETNPNGVVVATNQYDGFGRQTRNTRADGAYTQWAYHPCNPNSGDYACRLADPAATHNAGSWTIIVATESNNEDHIYRDDRTYLDALDRPIASRSKTLNSNYSWVGREYDSFGRVKAQSAPCDSTNCALHWKTNSYDPLGRLISSSHPVSESSSVEAVTEYGYSGRTQKITDAEGGYAIRIFDVLGHLRRTQDPTGYRQNFRYDSAGSLTEVKNWPGLTLFSATPCYGALNCQDVKNDMSLGARYYTYNSLGELVSSTDSKGQTLTLEYDVLSRVKKRTELEGVTDWTWGNSASARNIGQLAGVSMSGYAESYSYDSLGRLSSKTIAADQNYTYNFTYGNQGALSTITYPASTGTKRVKVQYNYSNGILREVVNATSGEISNPYWEANSYEWGGRRVKNETLGNNIETVRTFDAATGALVKIESGVNGGAGRQNESYLYDKVGNVTLRQQGGLGLSESFHYDDLHRLTTTYLGSNLTSSISYDLVGNIASRSDVGGGLPWGYSYGSRMNAVTSTGSGTSYTYDDNGNMTTRNGSSISWSSYDYPTQINAGAESASFYYGPDRQYYKQIYTGPSGTETAHYIGGLLEKVQKGSTTEWRHYIHADGQVVAIVERSGSASSQPVVHYPLEDHLGSTVVLTEGGLGGLGIGGGAIAARESFDAFGKPRNGSTWSGAVTSGNQSTIAGISRRGFTGHTMIGQTGLIHMNGRVYDSHIGRFLSPDPYVTNPGITQGFDRYAYVYNNPLSYTDPSGFSPFCMNLSDDYSFSWELGTTANPVPGSEYAEVGEVGTVIFYVPFFYCIDIPEPQIIIGGGNSGGGGGGGRGGGVRQAMPRGNFANTPLPRKTCQAVPNTDFQREAARGGDFSSYYQSRGADGDWYGPRGFDTSNGQDFLGLLALNRLHTAYLDMHTDGQFSAMRNDLDAATLDRAIAADAGWPAFRRDVSQRLAIAHMLAVDADFEGVPHNLNRNQVTAYHERVFADVGLPPGTFGGNALGRNAAGQAGLGLLWYEGCE